MLVGPGRAQFDEILQSILKTEFNYVPNTIVKYYVTFGGVGGTATEKSLVGFSEGDFLGLVQVSLKKYIREFGPLELPGFGEIYERMAAVDRVLSRGGGSALLAGRPGVG